MKALKTLRYSILRLALLTSLVCSADSLYSESTQKLHSSYLEFMNGVYDVSFIYSPITNRLEIYSYIQRTRNLSPTFGERIRVSNAMDFQLSRIALNGQLYQAGIIFQPISNDFIIANLQLSDQRNEQRGQIISTELISTIRKDTISSVEMIATYDVNVYKLIYQTIDPAGNITTASALIATPLTENFPLPMIAIQHGGIIKRSNAPSSNNIDSYSLGVAANGYYVVIADYLGLGESQGLHPLLHAQSLASSVIDALRAGRSLSQKQNILLNGQLFLMGYSEGGYATLAVQREIQNNYSNEFTISGSAPIASSYDLIWTLKHILQESVPFPIPSLLPYLILSFNQVYGLHDDLNSIFLPPFDSIIEYYFNGEYAFPEIDNMLPADFQQLFTEDFYSMLENKESPLYAALAENNIYRWKPQTPTRLYHCINDEIAPYKNSQMAYDYFLSVGAQDVRLIGLEHNYYDQEGAHAGCAIPLMLMAKEWFDTLRKTTAPDR